MENVSVTPIKRKAELVEIPGFGARCRVQLKSGGCEMIVREAVRSPDGKAYMVRCDWNSDGQPMTADYWPDQLWRIERFEID